MAIGHPSSTFKVLNMLNSRLDPMELIALKCHREASNQETLNAMSATKPAESSTKMAPFAFLWTTLLLANSFSKRSHQFTYDDCCLYVGPGLDGYVSKRRGFLGDENSQQPLPLSLQPLERVHGQLPILLRRGAVRKAVDSMPSLQDALVDLAREHMARAALLLSTLAHAYYFAPEVLGTAPLPSQIDDAWVELCQCLRRKFTGRVMADDILNNFRVSHRDTDYRLASSAFDIVEEKCTMGVQGAMELNFAPALTRMAEAQTFILAKDHEGTARCLEQISAVIRECSKVFLNITPQAAPQSFDPIIWAKTYLALGKVIREGELGNSGVDAPLFQALDCFLGRETRQDDYGVMQKDRRETLPQNIQKLLDALQAPSVALRPFVEKSDSVRLKAAFGATLQLYARLLEWHRVKAVGLTGVTIKSGHESTTGVKSSGAFAPSPTEILSRKIKVGIKSRIGSSDPDQIGKVVGVSVGDTTTSITLSFETALPLEAGDRIQVWPRNSQESVQRIASLLEQTFGKGSVRQHHLDRLAYQDLRGFGQLDYRATSSVDEVLSTVLLLAPRFYSIGSVLPDEDGLSAKATLTITHNRGMSAMYMTSLRDGDRVRATIHPCPRFNAPQDPTTPLILVGQGSGIGPLIGFLQARARSRRSAPYSEMGPIMLYIASSGQQQLNDFDELARLAGHLPRLSIQLAFSKEADCTHMPARHTRIHASTDRVTLLLQKDSRMLHTLMNQHSAHVFICGSTDFGIDVRRALGKAPKTVAARVSRKFTAPASTDWRRWHEDLFGSRKLSPERRITLTELAHHNAFDDCWTALDSIVYDLTRYLSLHPGGSKTMMESAGTRCDTRFYETHGGLQLQEIFGRLGAYAIGRLDERETNAPGIEALEATVRAQNALTNNTAFPADRNIPFYAYCDALILHVDQGLSSVRCALASAGKNATTVGGQGSLVSKYEEMKARCWQELRGTTSLKQLEAKEAEIREMYLDEAAGFHRSLDQTKMMCL